MRHMVRAILSFAVVAVLAYLAATSSGPYQQQQTTNQQRTLPNSVAIVSQPQTPDSEAGRSQPQSELRRYIEKLIEPSVLVSIALAIVAYRGIRVALATLKQLRKQTTANMIAANSAKKSADAAFNALAITERADLELRDWTGNLYNHLSDPPSYTFQVAFRIFNSGKQFAAITRIKTTAPHWEHVMPINFALPKNEGIGQMFTSHFTQNEMTEAVTNPFRVIVEIDHNDLFTERTRYFAYERHIVGDGKFELSFGPDLNYEKVHRYKGK